MNCKIFFTGTTDTTRMTVHVSQTPGGAGASISKSGIYKHLSDEKVWCAQGGDSEQSMGCPVVAVGKLYRVDFEGPKVF